MTESLGLPVFLVYAVLAGVMASIGGGLIGPYVVLRRIGYIAGGIAHAVLGAIGVAYYVGIDPLLGALVGAVVTALVIGWVTLRHRGQEDMVITALWAGGMAVGVLFLSLTPGYRVDLMSYLFGNVLLVSAADLWLMGAVNAMLALLVLAFHRQFLAVCFDEEFARLRGVPVGFVHLLLLCMIALLVVLLIQVVGLILVLALVSLPAAAASQWVTSVGRMMGVAMLVALLATNAGLAISYRLDLPPGALIVLLVAALYAGSLATARWLARKRRIIDNPEGSV